MIKEFKEFISQGSVMDLAVGTIIGAAFGKVVNNFVSHIVSPLIGLLTGAADLSSLQITLRPEQTINGEVVEAAILNIGAFLESVIDFLIIGMAIFLVIKLINKFRRVEEAEVEAPIITPIEVLLAEIRDGLQGKEEK